MGIFADRVINAPEEKKKIKGKPFKNFWHSKGRVGKVNNPLTTNSSYRPLELTADTTALELITYFLSLPPYKELRPYMAETIVSWEKMLTKRPRVSTEPFPAPEKYAPFKNYQVNENLEELLDYILSLPRFYDGYMVLLLNQWISLKNL